MKIFIVIPAYNEEKKIEQVVSQVLNLYKNVIVVDDGSTDSTYDVLKNIPHITLCRHIINRGQGSALATGTRKALLMGADVIVHFDADGQMRASDIENVTAPILKGQCDVALGSRFLDKQNNIPKLRKLILYLAKIFNSFFLRIPKTIKDPQSGFRAMSGKAAREIEITQDRMAHCSEILKEIIKKNLRYVEVPVRIIYTKYSLQKGQKASNALNIVWSLFISKYNK